MCKPEQCELWKLREGLKLMGLDSKEATRRVLRTNAYIGKRAANGELAFLDQLLKAKCPCDEGDEDEVS